MAVALLDTEGTWDEISARVGEWRDRRLHVIVLPAQGEAGYPRPIADILADVASAMPPGELATLPADFIDQLDHYTYGVPKS
jgi:hypothetical protein